MGSKNRGSSIDDFLKKEGIFEEAQAQAIAEVNAWQLAQADSRTPSTKHETTADFPRRKEKPDILTAQQAIARSKKR